MDGADSGERMSTPESKTKKKLKEELRRINAYQYWPVPVGYGRTSVDCLACIPNGWFVGYECKRKGIREPSPRQAVRMKEIRAAGGKTYVVTLDDLDQLEFIEITK